MPFDPTDPRLLESAISVARSAGAAILPFYRQRTAVRTKADASPVTAADEAADQLITRALAELTPSIPVVSEESSARFNGRAPGPDFWLVDPLDGTREFISERDEFTVNIALVKAGLAVLGVVYLPARDELYAGVVGRGATMSDKRGERSIGCRPMPEQGATIAVSRSHGDRAADAALLGRVHVAMELPAGSALKFCLLARGEADLYPRAGRTMEWDTAAGHAVLLATGGNVFDREGRPLAYGKPGFENPSFLATASATPPPR